MDPLHRFVPWIARASIVAGLLAAACAPAAPSPTAAPAKPAEQAAPTAAPAKPAEKAAEKPAAQPTAKPAEQAAPKPPAQPAAKTESKAEAKPAAQDDNALVLAEAEQQEVASFYRGKTLRIIVGFSAGGGYDAFARVTSRHFSRYLPGSPNVIVENMTGAGSLTAANHLYNAAPKDGTTIGTFAPHLVLVQAVGGGGGAAQFDPAKYPWLGSPTVSTNMCMLRTESGINSMAELVRADKEVVFGATTLGNATSIMPSLIREYLNPKVKVVTGYEGVAKIKLAVESGELDGSCGTWESHRSTHAEWFQGDPPFARVIVKAKEDPDGDLKDVPLLTEFLKDEEGQQIHRVASAPDAAGFIYAAPPGLPATRLKALRVGIFQTWNDPEFKAEADKAELAPIPQNYVTITRLMEEITSARPETLQRAKEVLGIQ